MIGRVERADDDHGTTEEDRLGARVAQDYVDFIRVRPWYEFDFVAPAAEAVARDARLGAGTRSASGSAATR